MSVEKITTGSSSQITPAKDKAQPITASDNAGASSKGTKKSHFSASSQMQLLNLAKQFVLDGSLVSPEKQMPLEDRIRKRERVHRIRRQQNLEAIVQKTLAYCSENEISDRADQDWFSRFVALAEDISNRTMQDLWAKILAKEIMQPGSFSLKTLKTFRSMNINDAKLFAKACCLAMRDNQQKSFRIISGCYQQPGLFNFFDKNREVRVNNTNWGLSYADLLVLADNDLMFIQDTESTTLAKNENVQFNYNGQALTLSALKNNSVLSFYKFTPIGSELAALIGDKPDNDYLNGLKKQLSHHFLIDN